MAGDFKPLRVLVAFSGSLSSSLLGHPTAVDDEGDDDDEADDYWAAAGGGQFRQMTERSLNGVTDVLSDFRQPGPALLIVCNKFETGFDEPRVCCLVVDRALRGAHAVQVFPAAPHPAHAFARLRTPSHSFSRRLAPSRAFSRRLAPCHVFLRPLTALSRRLTPLHASSHPSRVPCTPSQTSSHPSRAF